MPRPLAALCPRLLPDGPRGRHARRFGATCSATWSTKPTCARISADLVVSAASWLIFTVKGLATYGSAVQLARIGNSIVAENERRMFDKLLTENLRYFADRHSSEFMARLTTGAAAASQTLNLLITAVGRDLLSLVVLVAVMVMQDPVMSLVELRDRAADVPGDAAAGAARSHRHPEEVHERRRHAGDAAGGAAGHPHRQGVHAGRDDAQARAGQHRRRGGGRQQDGARVEPVRSADGGARRHRDRGSPFSTAAIGCSTPAPSRASSSRSWPRSCSPTSRRSGSPGSTSTSPHALLGVRSVLRVIDSAAERAERRPQAAARPLHRARRIPRRSASPTGRASRCSGACRSSPSPAASPRWSARRAAASRPCST